MEFNIEEISQVEREIKVKVPAEEVGAALDATIALYKVQTPVKGFRKGKVPASVIQSKYKKQIISEATTDLINYQINEILNEQTFVPVSKIDVDAKELVRDEDFEYVIKFEVVPEFETPVYLGLSVEEERAEVSEKELKDVEDRLLQSMAKIAPIEDDRPAKDGELACVTFSAEMDGEPIPGVQADNFDLPIGEGHSLVEFEEFVKTLKSGESGETEITFPEDFINSDLAGKVATMKVTVHAVKERKMPELTDDIVKQAGGFESVEKMREVVKQSYMANRKQLCKSAAQTKLIKGIAENLDFPLPPSLLEDRLQRMVTDVISRTERSGRSFESLGKTIEELREEQRPMAEESVRTEIFLLTVAQREEITVDPQEVEGALYQIAQQSQQDLSSVKSYYEENNLLIPLKDRLLADKAAEFIYENADVTEIDPVTPTEQ
ncbi:trigger factor [Maridesulfovibrio hydrothermalis]|uniref:Trigger factor n=1 Tax=Maridesulfovibrio hydrothermalis AM13 = DSM 14728 TaxID=1121451 RepID=L0RC59_9BACT|nr:trigger factor [Maridesulfovibrio hydrothermalis]CCO24363.1 Trigger factor [Maridesulfovibrio hydrothermalis AM13 = DSM 14728]